MSDPHVREAASSHVSAKLHATRCQCTRKCQTNYIREKRRRGKKFLLSNVREMRDVYRLLFYERYIVIALEETTQMFNYDWLYNLLGENPVKLYVRE